MSSAARLGLLETGRLPNAGVRGLMPPFLLPNLAYFVHLISSTNAFQRIIKTGGSQARCARNMKAWKHGDLNGCIRLSTST